MDKTPEQIAGKLTKAQREAVASSRHCAARGVHWPEGWYFTADKRVRYNLCRMGVIRDYLAPSNRLTSLGLAVRAIIQRESDNA